MRKPQVSVTRCLEVKAVRNRLPRGGIAPEARGEIQVDIDENLEFFGGRIGHDFEGSLVDKEA